jgi:hypothetical protein
MAEVVLEPSCEVFARATKYIKVLHVLLQEKRYFNRHGMIEILLNIIR